MIEIAGLPVEWQKENCSFTEKFLSGEKEPVIKIKFEDKMQECHSVQYLPNKSEHMLRGTVGDILLANEDWSEAVSYYHPDYDKDFVLPLAAICSRLSSFNTLLVHSSFVDFKGKGVIFTGYSGVGKTTQAELWKKFLGAEIVNGDKAFIRETDDGFFAYGLPWKGSSEYCLNSKSPLSAVVVLRQSVQNCITRLNETATEYLMPHVFLPHWDKDCLDKALDTFDSLLKDVPVFLLECRPDEDSVRLTHDEIFG